MKFLVLLIAFAALPAFAAGPDCEQSVREAAALKYANGNKKFANTLTSGAKLAKKKGESLYYNVEVFEQYSDGASTEEFPAKLYSVKARGTAEECDVIDVIVVKENK